MRNDAKNINHLDVKSLADEPRIVVSLKNVPLELRKKEASKPIYLVRYE